MHRTLFWGFAPVFLLFLTAGCRRDDGPGPDRDGRGAKAYGGSEGGSAAANRGGPGRTPGVEASAAVPVEVTLVDRRPISSFLETNGALEAENDVEIVARTPGPIVELAIEEGMRVEKGQLLLKIDETERRAEVEIAKVALADAERAHQRAKAARQSEIISQEVYDAALSQLESAQARLKGAEILYDYTTVTAPFQGIVVDRYVKLAENVTQNQPLFRVTDFDPLLCKIQVPERELSRLRIGQKAFLNVEAWPGERFQAHVLRISPVVDAATGTIRVTLQVSTGGRLRPGMFASVFLVIDTRENALTLPKSALSLDSLSDSIFVVRGDEAERRVIEIGYEESERIEILSGVEEGELVVVVGQDGLTDGTPIQIIAGPGTSDAARSRGTYSDGPPRGKAGEAGGRGISREVDFSSLSPERLERFKARMRERGMSDQQIEEIIRRRSRQR